MLEYMYVFVIVMTYQALSFKLETRVEHQRKMMEEQKENIEVIIEENDIMDCLNKSFITMICECLDEKRKAVLGIADLPKVPSATGQIYVDYEDVMQIIRGEELIER